MTTQRDVEQLLRRIPLETPEDESHAADILNMFVQVRNAAFAGVSSPSRLGGGISIPGTTTALSIPGLIDQMKRGDYFRAAATLIGVAGDAAAAFSILVTAGVEMGTISGTGALASAGVVTGLLGEAGGPAALAATVLISTFYIPINNVENVKKLFFLTDASGILTSWMFNMPEISPHTRLTTLARTSGPYRSDVSDACRMAHRQVHSLWRQHYQGNVSARRAAKAAAGDSWERYWQQVGAALEQRLRPLPNRVGRAWVQDQIENANRRMRETERTARQRQRRQAQRRAQGGYWFRTSDGLDLFMPDR